MPYRNIGRAPLTSLKTEFAKIAAKNDRTERRFGRPGKRAGRLPESGLPAGSEWDYRSPQLCRSSR